MRTLGEHTGNGVLDLNTRVDLDKVVPALLVDQELGGTGVSVSDGACELERIVENGLADRLVEMRSGGDFDNLRVSSFAAAGRLR